VNSVKFILPEIAICAAALAQAPDRTLKIAVDDPRPVAAVARSLEQRFGWVVTYEDPQWAAASELQDVTYRVRSDIASFPPVVRGLLPRVLVPKGGRIEFDMPAGTPPLRGFQRLNLINDLLSYHSMRGNPGHFSVREGSDGFLHIVPRAAKDTAERLAPQQPVLDRNVFIPERRYSGLEFLTAFVESVSRASGVPVDIGSVPINPLARVSINGGARNEPARDALARFLRGADPGYSWRLFFDPVDRVFYLNVHWIARPAQGER
jgi:hypothetical protein